MTPSSVLPPIARSRAFGLHTKANARKSEVWSIHFGDDAPEVDGASVPVWIRDGYSTSERKVVDAARAAGTDSPILFVYLPRGSADGLKSQIIRYEAASGTIQFKGVPSTPEGEEAKSAMETREKDAVALRNEFINEIIDGAKVFKGGGAEVNSITLDQKISEAGKAALVRMFPEFINQMLMLAGKAGGNSPLPPAPDTQNLLELRNQAGNERLGEILKQTDELKKSAEQWLVLGDLADKREPLWRKLKQFIRHGDSLAETSEIISATDGIRNDRLLLDATNHIGGLVTQAAGVLRSAVTDAHTKFQSTHASEMESLKANEAWARPTQKSSSQS